MGGTINNTATCAIYYQLIWSGHPQHIMHLLQKVKKRQTKTQAKLI